MDSTFDVCFHSVEESSLSLLGCDTVSIVTGYIFTLKVEAARPSETLVSYRIRTWCHNPEDFIVAFYHVVS
jgi:hypothetical protein